MRYTAVLLIGMIIGVFAYSCVEVQCPEPEIIHDTIDITCYPCIDSAWNVKKIYFDSLVQAGFDEVTTYREESIYQIDTMRSNFLSWMDSIKGLQIHDNLIIHGDTVSFIEARFDTTTGIPYLVFE